MERRSQYLPHQRWLRPLWQQFRSNTAEAFSLRVLLTARKFTRSPRSNLVRNVYHSSHELTTFSLTFEFNSQALARPVLRRIVQTKTSASITRRPIAMPARGYVHQMWTVLALGVHALPIARQPTIARGLRVLLRVVSGQLVPLRATAATAKTLASSLTLTLSQSQS